MIIYFLLILLTSLTIYFIYKNIQLKKINKIILQDLEDSFKQNHNMINTLYAVTTLVEQTWGTKNNPTEKEKTVINAIRESVYGN